MANISADDLRDFVQSLLQAGGFGVGDAAEMADLLVWANLRGIDSHGVLRVPRYIEMLGLDRKSTRLNSSHIQKSRMPSSA